jgi:hypothetical protein
VFVCTEPPDNRGMSITNAAEILAALVLERHPDVFDPFTVAQLPGISYDAPFIWIEHYEDGARGTPQDRATFDLVEFSHYEARDVRGGGVWHKAIGEPSWSPLDRGSVEALIGGPLE